MITIRCRTKVNINGNSVDWVKQQIPEEDKAIAHLIKKELDKKQVTYEEMQEAYILAQQLIAKANDPATAFKGVTCPFGASDNPYTILCRVHIAREEDIHSDNYIFYSNAAKTALTINFRKVR